MHVTVADNIIPVSFDTKNVACGFQSRGGMCPSSIHGLMHLLIISILAAAFIQVQHL